MATFVLVHGAFQGGWVWQRVEEALAELGHRVHRPTLSGCGHLRGQPVTGAGLAMFTQEIAQYLKDEGLIDVVLVGHSFAGLICCGVAQQLPGAVARLVLLDGVLPACGKSFADLGGEPLRKLLEAHAAAGGLVRPWPLEAFGVGPEPRVWFAERLGPFPLAAFTEPFLGNDDLSLCQRSYVSCLPAKNPLLRAMAARAGAEGWDMHALMSGHCAMVGAPLELAELLHGLARSAVRQTPTAAASARAAADSGLPPLDRQLLEDMRRQLHWTCRRLAQGGGEHLSDDSGRFDSSGSSDLSGPSGPASPGRKPCGK